MERIRSWVFPLVLVVGWLAASAHVLARLGELHSTLAAQQRPAEVEQPVSDAQTLARR
jgi:hypothetical protein